LDRCPTIRRLLASFETVLGEVRLRRLPGDGEVFEHFDTHYQWFRRLRFHLPLVTNPSVRFHCGSRSVHMGVGEAWLFDRQRLHRVTNESRQVRTHLIVDTVPTSKFWQLIRGEGAMPKRFPSSHPGALMFDREQTSPILAPGDVDGDVDDLLRRIAMDQPANRSWTAAAEPLLRRFADEWRATWARTGGDPGAWRGFWQLAARCLSGVRRSKVLRVVHGERIGRSLTDRLAVWMPSEGRYRVQPAPLHTMQILSQIGRKERVDAADPANRRCLAELVDGGVLAPA
jgi:hypothetical protein